MAHHDQSDEDRPQIDDASADKLRAYDEMLARGESSDSVVAERATLDEEGLQRQRGCIEMLRAAWPPIAAAGAGAGCPTMRTLGDFRLLRQIGHGGMGVVYEAEQISLGRRVALKILPFAAMLDDRHLARFKHEASAAAGLQHPHIVPVLAFGSEDGVYYYAMQYVEGEPLNKILHALRAQVDQDRIPIALPVQLQADDGCDQVCCRHYFRAVAELGVQAAEALDDAHQNGVIHRDVKPGNLLLDWDGNLWIADFGLARSETGGTLTMSGDVVGTLRYMSPEQASGKRAAAVPATDVYSLGATLYELLTLHPLFGRGEHSDLLRRIADEDPRPPRRLAADLPQDLETIVLKSLEKRPEDRYDTAQAMADDLQSFLRDEPIRAQPPTLRDRLVKWLRRHEDLMWVAAVFSALLIVVSSVGSVMLVRAARNAKSAEERATESAATASREKNDALRNLYRANVQTAHFEWIDGRVDRTLNLLDAVRPNRGGADHRNWEWYYVRSLCHGGKTLDGDLIKSAPSCPVRLICRINGDTYTFTDLESDAVRLVLVEEKGLTSVFGPAGRRLACAADPAGFEAYFGAADNVSNSLQVYDLASRSKKWEKRVTPIVDELDWSPSGDRIVTVHRGGRVNVWDANNGALLIEMDGDAGGEWFANVKWSPDGRWIAVGHGIWDAVSGKEAFREVTRSDAYRRASGSSLDWDPSWRRIATVNEDRDQLSVWDLDSDKPLFTLRPHRGLTQSVSWSPDGKSITTSGDDTLVKIWDAASGQLVNEYRGHTGHVYSVHWIDGGKRLASNGSGITKIWDPDAEQGYLSLPASGPITWMPSGKLVACSQNEKGWTYEFFDPDTGDVTASIEDNEAATKVICVSVDPAGRRLASSNTNGHLRIWDINTGELLGSIKANARETRSITWNPDGSMLATSGDDGFKVWDVKDHEMIAHLIIDDRRLPLDGSSVSWSPDGRTIVGVKSRDVWVWSTDDWRTTAEIRTRDGGAPDVNGLSWSPAGDRFVSSTGRFINIREVTTGRNLMEIKAHNTEVTSVTWSPDGKRIASGGRDHLIKLWDANTGEDMLTLRGHEDAVIQLAWSPDGRQLASSDGKSARIWDATEGYAQADD